MTYKFTREEYARLRGVVIEMRSKGISYKKISRDLGISTTTIREYIVASKNPTLAPRIAIPRAERFPIVREMLDQNKTLGDIADALKLSPYTVERYIRDVRRGDTTAEELEEQRRRFLARKRKAREKKPGDELREMKFATNQRFEDVKLKSVLVKQ